MLLVAAGVLAMAQAAHYSVLTWVAPVVTVNTTGTCAAGSTALTVASAASVIVYESVAGSGIPTGAYVAALSGTTVTLSAACTAAMNNAAVTFTATAPTGYNIKRGTAHGGPYVTVGTALVPALTYTDTASATNILTEGSTYYWVITATAICTALDGTKSACESANSPEASGIVPFRVVPSPLAPPTLSVTVN